MAATKSEEVKTIRVQVDGKYRICPLTRFGVVPR